MTYREEVIATYDFIKKHTIDSESWIEEKEEHLCVDFEIDTNLNCNNWSNMGKFQEYCFEKYIEWRKETIKELVL